MLTVPLPWQYSGDVNVAEPSTLPLFHTATDLWQQADRDKGMGFLIAPPMRLPQWALTDNTTAAQLARNEWVARNKTESWEMVKELWPAGMHPMHPIPSSPVDTRPDADSENYCIPVWLVNRYNGGGHKKLQDSNRLRTLTEAFVDHLYQDLKSVRVRIIGKWTKGMKDLKGRTINTGNTEADLGNSGDGDGGDGDGGDGDGDGDDGGYGDGDGDESDSSNENLDAQVHTGLPAPHEPHGPMDRIKIIIAVFLNRLRVLHKLARRKDWVTRTGSAVRKVILPSGLAEDDFFKAQIPERTMRWLTPLLCDQFFSPLPGLHHRSVKDTANVVIRFTQRGNTKWANWALSFRELKEDKIWHTHHPSPYCIIGTVGSDTYDMEYDWFTDVAETVDPITTKYNKSRQQTANNNRQPAADRGYEPLHNIDKTGAQPVPEKFLHLPKGCYRIPQQDSPQDSPPWHMCVSEDHTYSVLHHFHAADVEPTVCEDAECGNLKQPLNQAARAARAAHNKRTTTEANNKARAGRAAARSSA